MFFRHRNRSVQHRWARVACTPETGAETPVESRRGQTIHTHCHSSGPRLRSTHTSNHVSALSGEPVVDLVGEFLFLFLDVILRPLPRGFGPLLTQRVPPLYYFGISIFG